jgi:hypothetical protein
VLNGLRLGEHVIRRMAPVVRKRLKR